MWAPGLMFTLKRSTVSNNFSNEDNVLGVYNFHVLAPNYAILLRKGY